MRSGARLFRIFILSMGFVAQAGAEQVPIPIHLAAALTGVAASFGDMELKGATLAVEQLNAQGGVNGAPLQLIVEDTKANNRDAISAFKKLMSFNQAKVIIGPTWLDSFQGVLPLVDRAGIFVLAPSAAIPVFKKSAADHPFVYSVWFNIDREVEALLKHLAHAGIRRVAVVVDEDNFFQTVRSLFKTHASEYGVSVETDLSVPVTSQDFRSVVAKLRREKPEGIVFGFGGEENLFNFLKAAKQFYRGARLFGTDYLDGFSKDAKFRELLQEVEYVAPANHSTRFEKEFQARFGIRPVLSAGPAYDCVMLLVAAFRAGRTQPAGIRQFLLGGEFELVSMGKTAFDENGQVVNSPFRIKRISSEQ